MPDSIEQLQQQLKAAQEQLKNGGGSYAAVALLRSQILGIIAGSPSAPPPAAATSAAIAPAGAANAPAANNNAQMSQVFGVTPAALPNNPAAAEPVVSAANKTAAETPAEEKSAASQPLPAENVVIKSDYSNLPAASVEGEKFGTHVVKAGDSLWNISKKYYGDGKKWRKILEANLDKIKNPAFISPGIELNIPPV